MAHIDTSPVIRGAIWLQPGGDALDKIQKTIHRVHRRGGGPPVRPHITLLSGLETTQASAELKLKRLAQRMKPFTVRLGKIEWKHDYFKALFATVEASAELAAAQLDAYDAFEMKPAPKFEPHLSLLYGDLDEALQKELAAEAGGSIEVAFEVTAVHLVNASPSLPVTAWKELAQHKVS
jgi:2'-5' RNA ligase